jgi:hypothetical protein
MAALALMILVTAILATGKAKTTFDIVVLSTFIVCFHCRSDPARGVQEFHGPGRGTYCLSSFHLYHVSLRPIFSFFYSSAMLYSALVHLPPLSLINSTLFPSCGYFI